MRFNTKNKVIIAGHRGNPAKVNENTMQSFKSAIDLQVDMIETDIRMTKDGVLVLMHDEDVYRTTGQHGLVREMTFEELRVLNAGNENEHMLVPTLEELLSIIDDDMLLDLEIKVYKHIEGEEAVRITVDKTVELCERYNLCDRILFNSFDAYVLEYIHKKYGNKFRLHGYYPYSHMKNITEEPTNYLDYACYWSTGEEAKQYCTFLKQHGIEPCTGAKTTENDFYEAVEYGCSMFTENNPELAMEWRKKYD